jgi:hypothetical protein
VISRVLAIVVEHELGRWVAKSPGNQDRGKYKPATNARTMTAPTATHFQAPRLVLFVDGCGIDFED